MTDAERAQMRRAIAIDVIEQVAEGVYWAKRGTGFVFADNEFGRQFISPRKALEAPRCGVCALGGMMLSQIRLYNAAAPDVMNHHVDRPDAKGQLRPYFQDHELTLIEELFEGEVYWAGLRMASAGAALVCIMENLARNGRLNLEEPPRVGLVERELEKIRESVDIHARESVL